MGWEPPSVLPEPQRVKRVMAEIQRGLERVQPAYAKWCVEKLFVLPTQNASGLSAALMADNFIDACGHYPDDIWQSTTLELLRTKTFRPTPAEFVAIAEPRYAERKRMLERCKRLLPPEQAAKDGRFQAEPEEHRLRHAIWVGWERRHTFMGPTLWQRACSAEHKLAAIENRKPAPWVNEAAPIYTPPPVKRAREAAKLSPVYVQAAKAVNAVHPTHWPDLEPVDEYAEAV